MQAPEHRQVECLFLSLSISCFLLCPFFFVFCFLLSLTFILSFFLGPCEFFFFCKLMFYPQ